MTETTDLIFEDSSVNAHKFWSATVRGCEMIAHFGRIGSTGQIRRKTLASPQAAMKAYNNKVGEKLAKGYVYLNEGAARPTWSAADIAGAVAELGTIAKSLVAPARIGVPEVRPMLAEEIKGDMAAEIIRLAADDNIVFQGKVDGHRLMIHVGETLKVLGRAGQDSQHAPRFAQKAYADIGRLESCVLDGELVGDQYFLFDLPVHAGMGIGLDSPYRDRLEALEKLFADWAPNDRYRLLPTAHSEVDKTQLAMDWLAAGCEGIMAKELDGTYKPGRRVRTVRKLKFVRDLDAVIIGIGAKGHDNYVLGVYKDGVIVEIGRCSAIGKTRCEIGDVATIRYLYVGADGRLYQPRFMVRRTDKAAIECTYDQVANAHVNKEIPDWQPTPA